MPVKIGFTIISSTGEDERYRATELNYHGPTVRGWRSSINCTYPQEIIMQLNMAAVIHRIQILSHQYLIPQKIEIWISEGFDYDPSLSPSSVESFEYLGFITLSDNQSTAFKSRELKSITVPPTTARYIKLRLHSNHVNEKNLYNQIGLIAVNVLGDEIQELDTDGDEVNNNGSYYSSHQYESTLISNPQYVSPYDDLAFAMYVDKDIARIMRIMEAKKHKAVLEERFEYASKLKVALEDLREVGETLGKFEQEKRQAINTEDYDKAKLKKLQIDQYREQVYRVLEIDKLLELDGVVEENDLNSSSLVNRSIRKQELAPPQLENLETEKLGKIRRGTPSPIQENLPMEREEKSDWDYQSQLKNINPFNRSLTPNQLIHSQSQTSFDRYSNREDSPPLFASQYFPYSNSMQNSQVFTTAPAFQIKTPPYNSHTWQSSAPHEASEMYHSMPMPQTVDRRTQVVPDKSETLEFQQLQRNYSDGELKSQFGYNQRAVEYESSMVPTKNSATEVEAEAKSQPEEGERESARPKSPVESKNLSKSPSSNAVHRPNSLRGSLRRRNKSSCPSGMKSSYEAYEERMLPALRHYNANEIVRECQLGLVEPTRKSKLNEREKKQAALPISVFGIELVEKFYSKHFDDKEEGLKQLQNQLKRQINSNEENPEEAHNSQHSPNKIARAAIFLLHRALRDKVYSVYSSAADTIRLFFSEYVPKRVSSAEVARSVEKLLPELIAKSGDSTPRIHNMAAHTLLSMADCKEVRELHIIPVHLSRPLTSSVHPRLALSRLEMIEQLILNHGISTDKQSGLTCRTLAEFGSSGLHHPAEAVRKVSERILIQVYRVNPRLVRKQLPPDDDITRRNLLYRQLFQEFDIMDLQRKRELMEKSGRIPPINRPAETQNKIIQSDWEAHGRQETADEELKTNKVKKERILPVQIPKRTVNQQTSPMKPFSGFILKDEQPSSGILRSSVAKKENPVKNSDKSKISVTKDKPGFYNNGEQKASYQLDKRKGMSRIAEEKPDLEAKTETANTGGIEQEKSAEIEEDVTLKFPNLVDSVRVAEEKLSFTHKGIRNFKSLKYIFPTTYIGNSTTSQAAITTSNTVNSFCKITKKPEWGCKTQPIPYSGIPVPTNGRYPGLVSPKDSVKKFQKPEGDKKLKSPDGKAENEENSPEKEKKGSDETETNPMTESLFFDGKTTPERGGQHTNENSNFTGSPSEGDENNAGPKPKNTETKQSFRMCIFCFASDNWFTEESLNQHYWKSCPMLTRCSYCDEVVEISGLIQHRLDDCEDKHLFLKCEICQEAVLKEQIKCHECIASENKNPKTRCSLCHSDIGNEEAWREHLMGKNICPNHPKKRDAEEHAEKKGATTEEKQFIF